MNSIAMSRRSLLTAMQAASITLLLPIRAKAQYEAAFPIVSGVVSGIAGLKNASSTAEWQTTVSHKIDDILGNTEIIIEDIRRLKIEINEMFITNDFNNLIIKIKAKKQMLDVIIDKVDDFRNISASDRATAQFISDETEDEAFQLMSFGAGGYSIVLVGYAIISVVYKILGKGQTDVDALSKKYISYLTNSLDTYYNSWQNALKLIPANTKKLDDFEYCLSIPCMVGQRPTPGIRSVYYAVTFSGNRTSGYSLRSLDPATELLTEHLWKSVPGYDIPMIDTWDQARQRGYQVAHEVSQLASDLQWAQKYLGILESSVHELISGIILIEGSMSVG